MVEPLKRDPKQKRINISTGENSGMMAFFGTILLGMGFTGFSGRVEVLRDGPFFWIASGGIVLLMALGFWWCRVRADVSEQGVCFLPRFLNGKYDFQWDQVLQWHWHRYSYTNTDGGETEEKELLLLLMDGRKLALIEPFCHELIAQELEARIGQESISPKGNEV